MPLSKEDLAEVTTLFSGLLKTHSEEQNKAVEALIGKAVPGVVAKSLEGLKLDDKFKAIDEKIKPPETDKDKGTDKKSKADDDDSPAVKRLAAELAEEKKKREATEAKAREQEVAQKAEHLRQRLTDALVTGGADPKRVRIAVNDILAQGKVKYDDQGAIVWLTKETWGEDSVPVADAAKKWLGTDDGKFFVPPTGHNGTGERGGQPAAGSTSAPRTKEGGLDWSAVASKARLAPVLSSVD